MIFIHRELHSGVYVKYIDFVFMLYNHNINRSPVSVSNSGNKIFSEEILR